MKFEELKNIVFSIKPNEINWNEVNNKDLIDTVRYLSSCCEIFKSQYYYQTLKKEVENTKNNNK